MERLNPFLIVMVAGNLGPNRPWIPPIVAGARRVSAAAHCTPSLCQPFSAVANRPGATPMQVALAWLLHRPSKILLIPGTSSVARLRENLAATRLTLSLQVVAELDDIAAAAVAAMH